VKIYSIRDLRAPGSVYVYHVILNLLFQMLSRMGHCSSEDLCMFANSSIYLSEDLMSGSGAH
jgi:hypothetical protein